jgi:hypothetical protein
MFTYRIFGNAFHRRRCFCIGGRAFLRRRPVVLIGKVARKFAYRVSNLDETFPVKRAALGIGLR